MRVLMVISQFHPIVGGAERQAQLLAEALLRKGAEVRVVTGRWLWGTRRNDIVGGIRVFRNFACWRMFGIRGLRALGGLFYMVSLGIYLVLHRREYDVIHVHQMLYPAFVCVLIGKSLLGKPVVVKTASSGLTSDIRQLKHFPSGALQLKYLLKEMECLVAVSRTSGKEFVDVGYPESRIEHIPNGVALPEGERREVSEMAKHVLTTTRLSREKGVDVLLRAWGCVLEQEKNLRLSIVGGGPLEQELRSLAQSLGLAPTVDFAGLTYDVGDSLRRADLFVLPSRTEGLSNALLEAMAHGIPCIATCVGGNKELLEWEGEAIPAGGYVLGKGGLLVNSEDVDGLSQGVVFLARNRDLRGEIGKRGRAHVRECYSIDRVADQYMNLYHRLLGRRS